MYKTIKIFVNLNSIRENNGILSNWRKKKKKKKEV